MHSISWEEGRACGGDNAEMSGDLVSWFLEGGCRLEACLRDGAEDCDIRALGTVDRARDRRTRRQSISG